MSAQDDLQMLWTAVVEARLHHQALTATKDVEAIAEAKSEMEAAQMDFKKERSNLEAEGYVITIDEKNKVTVKKVR